MKLKLTKNRIEEICREFHDKGVFTAAGELDKMDNYYMADKVLNRIEDRIHAYVKVADKNAKLSYEIGTMTAVNEIIFAHIKFTLPLNVDLVNEYTLVLTMMLVGRTSYGHEYMLTIEELMDNYLERQEIMKKK